MKICNVKECCRKHYGKDLCIYHYKKEWQEKQKDIFKGYCRIEGCQKKNYEGGYCVGHYSRWHRHRYNFDKGPIKKFSDYSQEIQRPDFFTEINSAVSAEFLGFMLADGNVMKPNIIQIGLHKQDVDILEKFCDAIGLDHQRIKTYYNTIKLQFRNQQMFDDLGKWGVVPRKSLIAKVPEDIPPEFLNCFWRGCVEGDGS